MDVEADVVGAVVPHDLSDILEIVDDPQRLQLAEAVFTGQLVDGAHGHAGLDDGEHMLRGVVDALVQRLLSLSEFAVGGPGAGHVVALIVLPRAHIVQHHVAVGHGAGIVVVMDAEVVLPAADDGGEGRGQHAAPGQGVVELCLQLVLLHAGAAGGHHGLDAGPGDGHGAAHGVDLAGLLDGAQRPHAGAQVAQPQPGPHSGGTGRKLPGLIGLLVQGLPVKVQPQPVKALVGGQPVEVVLKALDVPAVGEAVALRHVRGVDPAAEPPLLHGILLLQIDGLLHRAAALDRQIDEVLLLHAGQVQEIAVGKEGVIGIGTLPGRVSGKQHRNAVLRQRLQHPAAVLLIKGFG